MSRGDVGVDRGRCGAWRRTVRVDMMDADDERVDGERFDGESVDVGRVDMTR